MKLAVITDSSAFLQAETLRKEDLFMLDIPVNIDGQEYVEGVNLTAQEFYEKMARSSELPKTSQPSIAKLDEILSSLKEKRLYSCFGSLPFFWNLRISPEYPVYDG